ncbi:hypothetical protein Tco_1149786, partial [Tanacetum coccineum]
VRTPSNDFKASFFLLPGFYSELRDLIVLPWLSYNSICVCMMKFEGCLEATTKEGAQGGNVASLVAKERNRGACKLLGWLLVIEVEISSWRGARVGVRTYLLGGAIDGSEANGIIRDPKLELESSRFTFDLVPLSYESVDVNVGGIGTWRKRNLKRIRGLVEYKEDELTYANGVENDCWSLRKRIREEKMYVKFSNNAKRKLSRCGRNQMGNEPILALPEGADDNFIVYYDARSKDLKACLEKGRRYQVNETWRVIYSDHECLQHAFNQKD